MSTSLLRRAAEGTATAALAATVMAVGAGTASAATGAKTGVPEHPRTVARLGLLRPLLSAVRVRD